MRLVRLGSGIAAIVVSQNAVVSSKHNPDPALRQAVLLLGIFILGHLALEVGFTRIPVRSGPGEPVPDPFSSVANVLVTTPGVILGLLAVFGSAATLTSVVKVAAVALVTALLLAIVLNGLVSMQDTGNPPRSTVIRLMFNLTLWALTFGVLGIAMGIVYRS